MFIKEYHRAKGLGRPLCFKEGRTLYPRIAKIRQLLGLGAQSSDESQGYVSEHDNIVPELKKIGADTSIGKETELFGISLKNVNGLEKGLGPKSLGKTTNSLLLENIDDMSAYPRHISRKNSEALGEFVEAVTDMNNQYDGRRGGTKDTGWRHKSRNALEAIKNEEGLTATLAYILEESHNILETCQGDLESILINAIQDEGTATTIISNSYAMRIARDTLNSYQSILNHLASVNNTRGWAACSSQLKHHSEKIGLIRGKYRHRIQMICRIYIYFRDEINKNWTSLKLQ